MAANYNLTASDFPSPQADQSRRCRRPGVQTPLPGERQCRRVWTNNFPARRDPVLPPCVTPANIVSDVNDVVSSMGVVFNKFSDIAPIGAFQPASSGVAAVAPDLAPPVTPTVIDPIPGFQGFRRVEPRNTPTMQAAAFNFDNFWDGRARHDFNGGSVFGAADPQAHVFVATPAAASLTATRQIIRFASLASLATGPGLSEFEMSFAGPQLGQDRQEAAPGHGTRTSSRWPTSWWHQRQRARAYSNQGGSACTGAGRS